MNEHPILSELARFGQRLGLDRMQQMLTRLGSPHRDYPVIHVAGTNGKGSVVRLVGAMLRAAGLRVGEYTSPHLQRVNERIRVDGVEIDDGALSSLLEELHVFSRSYDSALSPDQCSLTYFEMMTAAAFLHMSRSDVDVAVVEVGLGGRLDATNLVDPVVTAITTIGLDHTEQLGPDLASIAAEKAGIMKSACPVVLGPLSAESVRVIRTIAVGLAAPLVQLGRQFRIHQGRDSLFSWSDSDVTYRDLQVGLKGDHQIENAGVAIAIVRQLPPELEIDEGAIRRGLKEVRYPGRLEWLAPDLLVDCAHNSDGAIRLADYLRNLPRDRDRCLLLGMSQHKDARSMVITLSPFIDRVYTTRCAHPRATSPGDLAASIIGVDVPVLPAGPIENALSLARTGKDLVIASGSVFLAGAVRDIVGVR